MNDENNIIISSSTMMLVPYNHPYYRTKLIDSSGNHLYSCQTALQLIQKSCLTNIHSTYQGRRNAVKQNLNLNKTFQFRSIIENIFVFSPNRISCFSNCIWLFFKHVQTIEFFKKLNELKFIFQTELP